jgi:hypothetical protein
MGWVDEGSPCTGGRRVAGVESGPAGMSGRPDAATHSLPSRALPGICMATSSAQVVACWVGACGGDDAFSWRSDCQTLPTHGRGPGAAAHVRAARQCITAAPTEQRTHASARSTGGEGTQAPAGTPPEPGASARERAVAPASPHQQLPSPVQAHTRGVASRGGRFADPPGWRLTFGASYKGTQECQ